MYEGKKRNNKIVFRQYGIMKIYSRKYETKLGIFGRLGSNWIGSDRVLIDYATVSRDDLSIISSNLELSKTIFQ